jgi:hypothetical protein
MPYCTIEEAWDLELAPDAEKNTLNEPYNQPYNYGYPPQYQSESQLKKLPSNPSPMDIPRPQYTMKEHLSEFERETVPISSNNQYVKLIEDLKNENNKLKNKISELKNLTEKQQDKDSLFDVILYISTGIFVIYMMDNISTMGRRF